MKNQYDIILLGANLAGTSLLLALRELNLKILVIEKELPSDTTVPAIDNSRPITLNAKSLQHLQSLNVLDTIAPKITPILTVQVSERGQWGGAHFSAQEENIPKLGAVIPFETLRKKMLQQAETLQQVEWVNTDSAIIEKTDATGASITHETKTHEKITATANLLIVATGNNPAIRKQLGINAEERNHDQIAITARVVFEKPHNNTAYQRFRAPGVLALLPLLDKNTCGLVWTLPSHIELAKNPSQIEKSPDLQSAFGHRLGNIQKIEYTGSHSLVTTIAETQIKPGVVLVGNSAHTIYPLAAQGFNLSLRDVMELASILKTAHHQKKALGELSVLEKYVENRLVDQEKTIHLVEKTDSIFKHSFMGAGLARRLGFIALTAVPGLKRKIAQALLGSAGS